MNSSVEPVLVPTKAQELGRLLQEFQQEYAQSEAAQTFLGALDDARLVAQKHYRDITLLAQRGEAITDTVLLNLLPYSDTPRNRWRGAWIHPAPAIVGDLRGWYEAAGWTQPDEWPAIASALLHFVRQAVEEPTQLAAACRSFRLLPYTTGFQSGILSPILNALRPKHYLLFNQPMRRTLNYFTERGYTQALADYPLANTALHELLAELDRLGGWQRLPATQRIDYFHLFCHWLVREKDFRFRPRRYWLHSVGEDRWLWQEWREGNMITIGWDELGDLSGVRKREFVQRRDSLIAQHPTWRKHNAEQVWRFARQMAEGDQVLVHDGQTLIGAGTICGAYYYVAELPLGHRHPIEWTDLTPRLLPAGAANAELRALSAEEFAALATAPPIVQEEAAAEPSATDSAPLPDFVRFLAPLINTLQSLGGSGRAGEVVEAILSQLDEPTHQLADARERYKQQIYRARRLLVRAGLIDSAQRGIWQLTEAGKALALSETQAAALFTETLYQQRLSASLRSESTTMRRLAELPVPYTVAPVASAEPAAGVVAAVATEHAPVEPVPPPSADGVSPAYSLAECAAATYIPEETLARWVSAIERKGQAIFYGPPGVGKTYLAEELAAHLVGGGDGLIELVQFHAAYAYEDFVQGIRPLAGPDGQVRYEVIPGRLLAFCQRAAQHTGRSVLIIDEINRADLARVFGELMYLLEYRTRSVRLAADGRPFTIPANVRILGTMNTADRSIALLDHALRRRFAFIALQPDYEVLRRYQAEHAPDFAIDSLITLLRRINSEIGDAHYAIGHSFFLHPALAQALPEIWQLEIEPYLEEYFFDQPERVTAFRWAQIRAELGL